VVTAVKEEEEVIVGGERSKGSYLWKQDCNGVGKQLFNS
jgi:hypothetical protein